PSPRPALPLYRNIWALAALAVAFLAVAAAIVFGLLYWDQTSEPQEAVRSYILPPDKVAFNVADSVISPDGKRIAFRGNRTDGSSFYSLWIRSLNSLTWKEIPGTQNGLWPFWSPDGRYLGFWADGKLKKVDLLGGAVETICDAPSFRGATWNKDGTILFSPLGDLLRVPSTGGSPQSVLKPSASERLYRWPWFLPDGKHFLFFLQAQDQNASGIYVASL